MRPMISPALRPTNSWADKLHVVFNVYTSLSDYQASAGRSTHTHTHTGRFHRNAASRVRAELKADPADKIQGLGEL